MTLDLGKLVRVETLFNDISDYFQKRQDTELELKDQYAIVWQINVQKYKPSLFLDGEGKLLTTFITDYSSGAAQAFGSVVSAYFPKVNAQKLSPANPTYYVMLLQPANTIDLMIFLEIAPKALQEVDSHYQEQTFKKIKTQLEDKWLKENFVEDYDNLFKEHSYEIVNCKELEASAFAQYLFLLADNKIEEVLKRQVPGMEQIKRYGTIIIPKENDENTGTRS